ncbi:MULTISPECIES: WGR domain-containing protein [unclassified Sinorhizobium]|uniref:WGR domain-containing protein n=1 Tax=unclassified Sinorhizobium TaxID=2613772 RepID=UPI0024C469B9|nr:MULTISPECIES: WGR domain-containing protein [unclassified Sinorhizobium]MDK1376389.1 WGR domain-containing protein [Sinorhizobium sp. 6-70]MDK1482343.1 WGR domain-containing protein [Sinorhizobium sp. 6-117]
MDADGKISDSVGMIAQPYQLYVERTDDSKNMARYYAMSIEPTLFGDACLTRRWGRIGASGQQMIHHFDREEDAVQLFLDLLRQKRKRGYRPPAFVTT